MQPLPNGCLGSREWAFREQLKTFIEQIQAWSVDRPGEAWHLLEAVADAHMLLIREKE